VGVDASSEMLAVARERTPPGLTVEYVPGDAHALPFPDRRFDAAVCFRVLMHTPGWRQCVAELCRVSRTRVVLDFPALGSFAALESLGRRAAHAMGRRTEPYRVLRERAVAQALDQHGFRVVSVHRQFVLPIAFHKAFDSLPLTLAVERICRAIGLLRALGSPVTMVAER
jgi:ubiquinone/menaquinone biosynthesis C-methylase UbiE